MFSRDGDGVGRRRWSGRLEEGTRVGAVLNTERTVDSEHSHDGFATGFGRRMESTERLFEFSISSFFIWIMHHHCVCTHNSVHESV